MSIARPAQLALAGYALVCLSVFFPMPADDRDEKGRYSYRLKERLVVLGLLLLPMALSILSIHCMVSGEGETAVCGTWSWVNAAIVMMWALLVTIGAGLGAFSKDAVEGFKDKASSM
jgi:hypothetical protein